MTKKGYLLLFFAFIGLSFALYGNTLYGEFVYDDEIFASRPELRTLSHLPAIWSESYIPTNPEIGAWRPLSTTTFALNFILFGESPVSFHLVSILLNGVVGFLAFLLFFRLFNSIPLALFSALLFALFPIQTAAVASMKTRDDLLVAFFTLAGWLAFLQAMNVKKWKRTMFLAGSSLLVLLAIFCKEPAIVAPFIFLAVYGVQSGSKPQTIAKVSVWFLIPIALSLLLRWIAVGGTMFSNWGLIFVRNPLNDAPFWTGIWTAFAILATYITKTFIPLHFSATYTFNHFPLISQPLQSVSTLAGIAFLGILLFSILWKKTRATSYGIGGILFLISYICISRFVFRGMGGEIIEEHWIYFPSIGLALIAGTGFFEIYKRKKWLGIGIFFIVAALYIPTTIARNRVWANERVFYQAMLNDAPGSVQAHLNMAIIALNDNDISLAKKYALNAYNIYSDHHRVLNLLGKIALAEGNLQQAEDYFFISMSVLPQNPDAHKLYALALAKQGKFEESLRKVSLHIGQHPDDPQLRFLMAVDLYKLGRNEEATEFFDWDLSLSEEERLRRLESF